MPGYNGFNIALFAFLIVPISFFGQSIQFIKQFDVTTGDYELEWQSANQVIETTDGGYIISGFIFNGMRDPFDPLFILITSSNGYVLKTDKDGNEQWVSRINKEEYDFLQSVQQTTDGGYIVAGTADHISSATGSDVLLIKLDASGNEEWSKRIDRSYRDYGYAIKQTTDGGYIITGYSWDTINANYDVYLLKTDVAGNIAWQKTYGGIKWDKGRDVIETTDGGYVIVGESNSTGPGVMNVYLMKTDATGNFLWENTFGSAYVDIGYSLDQTDDDGFIIAAERGEAGGHKDFYLIKTSSTGKEEWSRAWGGQGGQALYSVEQAAFCDKQGYIVAGHTTNLKSYIALHNIQGKELWNVSFDTLGGVIDITQTKDGGFVAINGNTIIRIDPYTCDVEDSIIYVPNAFSPNGDGSNDVFKIYGNNIVTLQLDIFDRWGEKVFEINDIAQNWDGNYRGAPLNSAVFAYTLYAETTKGELISRNGTITLIK